MAAGQDKAADGAGDRTGASSDTDGDVPSPGPVVADLPAALLRCARSRASGLMAHGKPTRDSMGMSLAESL